MATKTNKDDGRVDVYVRRGEGNVEGGLLVSVNDRDFLLPEGKTSRVPIYVAQEIERSRQQAEFFDSQVDKLVSAQ